MKIDTITYTVHVKLINNYLIKLHAVKFTYVCFIYIRYLQATITENCIELYRIGLY